MATGDERGIEYAEKTFDAQMCIRDRCYTLGDAYTLDYWRDIAKRIEDMGADSLCIKDMAGLLTPCLLYTSRCV